MLAIIDRLLTTPSGGAHEQFLFAALLSAALDELNPDLRVVTRNLSAPDAPTASGGDVEIRHGQNLVEAYEVSANVWSDKLAHAVQVLRSRPELRRVNVVAPAAGASQDEIVARLDSAGLPPGEDAQRLDVAVLDIRAECASLAARLSQHGRRAAIEKLYDYLRTLQPRPERVEQLVELLEELGLTRDQ